MGQSLGNLIKFLDPILYKEYSLERFKEGKIRKEPSDFDFTPSKQLRKKTTHEKSLIDTGLIQDQRPMAMRGSSSHHGGRKIEA